MFINPIPEIFKECLRYDPLSGAIVWTTRPRAHFSTERAFKSWNSFFPGKPAFSSKGSGGYLQGKHGGKHYKAHRVAWFLTYGCDASGDIDHINGIVTDNRLSNLRQTTGNENHTNCRIRSDNKSGFHGVSLMRNGRWRASIRVARKNIHLGVFAEKVAAVDARKQAEAEHGFHPNHGQRNFRTDPMDFQEWDARS